MLNLKAIEQLAERISALLPADATIIQNEFKSNVKAVITSVLTRMDLVTRDEFEAQSVLLKRTREKLDRLEAEIAALQNQPKSN